MIEIQDREALCIAICQVLAALPENQRVRSFHALALPALDCFEKMTVVADNSVSTGKSQEELGNILGRVADEIRIFTAMARTFADACFANDSSTESGGNTASVPRVAIPAPLLVIIRKVWPVIVHVAATYSENEVSGTSCLAYLFGSTNTCLTLNPPLLFSSKASGNCSRHFSC